MLCDMNELWSPRCAVLIVNFTLGHTFKKHGALFSLRCSTTVSGMDVMDSFISQLVKSKANKWKLKTCKRRLVNDNILQEEKKRIFGQVATGNNELNLNLDEGSLEMFLLDAAKAGRCKDVVLMLRECLDKNLCPPKHLLQDLASIFAASGMKDGVELVQQVCSKFHKREFQIQAGFKHSLAEAYWKSGKIEEALVLFKNVYEQNVLLRKRVKLIVKFLIVDVVSAHSEANLVQLTRFCQYFVSSFGDYECLAHLWKCCFTSEWHADHVLAKELLENTKDLKHHINHKVPEIWINALSEGDTETVYRLLEILLFCDMRAKYGEALRGLFDYQYSLGNLKGCSAILQSSLKLEIPLSAVQHQKLLKLLLRYRAKETLFLGDHREKKIACIKPAPTKNYVMKF